MPHSVPKELRDARDIIWTVADGNQIRLEEEVDEEQGSIKVVLYSPQAECTISDIEILARTAESTQTELGVSVDYHLNLWDLPLAYEEAVVSVYEKYTKGKELLVEEMGRVVDMVFEKGDLEFNDLLLLLKDLGQVLPANEERALQLTIVLW